MPTIFIITNLEFVSLIENLVETLEQSLTNVGVKCKIPKFRKQWQATTCCNYYQIFLQEGPMEKDG